MMSFLSKMFSDDPAVSSGRIAGVFLVLVGAGLCIYAATAKNSIAVTAAAACLTAGLGALGIKGVENIKKITSAVAPPVPAKTTTATTPPVEKIPPKD